MPNTALRSRLLQKSVDVKFIRDWVPEKARRRIDLHTAWEILRTHYCAALYARGVCPVDCLRCKDEIVDMFRLEEATKPAALLTWLAKDHSTKAIERLIAAEKAGEQFPALETLTAQEQLAALFPERSEPDLIEGLKRFYE